MSIFPKVMYRCNANSTRIKITTAFSQKEKKNPKLSTKAQKNPEDLNTLEREQ